MFSVNLIPGKTVGTDLLTRLDSNTGKVDVWDRNTNTWVTIKETAKL